MSQVQLDPLTALAVKYGTDKCPQIRHPYTPAYFALLEPYRTKFKKVVELGVGFSVAERKASGKRIPGASLKMWRDFFPKAKVYGLDYQASMMVKGEPRITTILCDAMRPAQLRAAIEKIGKDIDLFVDDASHIPDEQVSVCKFLMPKLQKSVIYVIEDVGAHHVRPIISALEAEGYAVDFPRLHVRVSRERLLVVRRK